MANRSLPCGMNSVLSNSWCLFYFCLDFLLKFSLFRHPETEKLWILPSDIPSNQQLLGSYRLNWKCAIDELGGRTTNKKWLALVPPFTTDGMRRNLVWRDGMSEHILWLLRGEAQKRLFSLRRHLIFHANVDANLTTATVGENIGPRLPKPERITADSEIEVVSEEQTKSTQIANDDTRSSQDLSTETISATDAGTISDQSLNTSIPRETDNSWQSVPPLISAILYLGPCEDRYSKEFKSINVVNQPTQAVLFNLRCLFPANAERILSNRTKLGNALGIQSSEMSGEVLRHMLRLALYLEGDKTADIVEEGNGLKAKITR